MPPTSSKYIRPDAPLPPQSLRRGVRSEAWTPATLDLAERARLAVNGMVEPTDPEADYRVYWKASFRFNPPVMYHDGSDTGITLKFLEATPRMRIMCGSEQGIHVEDRWREVLLRMIGLRRTGRLARQWTRADPARHPRGPGRRPDDRPAGQRHRARHRLHACRPRRSLLLGTDRPRHCRRARQALRAIQRGHGLHSPVGLRPRPARRPRAAPTARHLRGLRHVAGPPPDRLLPRQRLPAFARFGRKDLPLHRPRGPVLRRQLPLSARQPRPPTGPATTSSTSTTTP